MKTKSNLILAAALIACGPVSASAAIQQTQKPQNENTYSRLNLSYDLTTFKASHVVVEEFQSLSDSSNRYTSEGTYSINGNTVATDIDGVLANIYGRKINFRMNGNKLELLDDIWPITFTRI